MFRSEHRVFSHRARNAIRTATISGFSLLLIWRQNRLFMLGTENTLGSRNQFYPNTFESNSCGLAKRERERAIWVPWKISVRLAKSFDPECRQKHSPFLGFTSKELLHLLFVSTFADQNARFKRQKIKSKSVRDQVRNANLPGVFHIPLARMTAQNSNRWIPSEMDSISKSSFDALPVRRVSIDLSMYHIAKAHG